MVFINNSFRQDVTIRRKWTYVIREKGYYVRISVRLDLPVGILLGTRESWKYEKHRSVVNYGFPFYFKYSHRINLKNVVILVKASKDIFG